MLIMKPTEALQALRSFWWVVVIACLVAGGVSTAYARIQTPVYRSSVRLELSGRFDYGAQLTVERTLRPLAQRVRTSEVAREVDQRLRLDLGPDRLLSKVRAEANVDNAQIVIETDDSDPALAERLALEFGRVFEEQHAARNQGLPQSERSVVALLDRPTPASLVSPQTRAIVPVAVALGAVLGSLLTLALAYVDDTVKSPREVGRYLNLPTLALIPGPIHAVSRDLRLEDSSAYAAQGTPP